MIQSWTVNRVAGPMERMKVLERAADLEPRLRQTVWPPLTYMLIPSLLDAADEVIVALAACPEQDEEIEAALTRIKHLRTTFRRER